MKNIKWSHFEDEEGNKTNVAAVHGYDFRDRILEDVFFNITINNKGELTVKEEKDAGPYLSQFNLKPIYKDALEFAETNDIFHAKDGKGDSELLSPRGKLVVSHPDFDGFGAAWHDRLARCIMRDMYNLDKYVLVDEFLHKELEKPLDNCYMHLEDLRWRRLHGFAGMPAKWLGDKYTNRQKRVVREWCLENEVALSAAVEDWENF